MKDTMTETAPERIWLQVDPCGNPDDRSEPCPDPSDVDLTWCWTQVGGQEIEYVRADLVRALLDGLDDHWVTTVEGMRAISGVSFLTANAGIKGSREAASP